MGGGPTSSPSLNRPLLFGTNFFHRFGVGRFPEATRARLSCDVSLDVHAQGPCHENGTWVRTGTNHRSAAGKREGDGGVTELQSATKKPCSCPCRETKDVQEWLHCLDITTFTVTGGKTVTTLSPPDMQKPGVVSTRLAVNKSDETTRKMAHKPEKTVKKLPDLMLQTDMKTGMNQGPAGTEGGANCFFTSKLVASVSLKHDEQLKIGNTKFPKSAAS